jgi:hypothetical protein
VLVARPLNLSPYRFWRRAARDVPNRNEVFGIQCLAQNAGGGSQRMPEDFRSKPLYLSHHPLAIVFTHYRNRCMDKTVGKPEAQVLAAYKRIGKLGYSEEAALRSARHVCPVDLAVPHHFGKEP